MAPSEVTMESRLPVGGRFSLLVQLHSFSAINSKGVHCPKSALGIAFLFAGVSSVTLLDTNVEKVTTDTKPHCLYYSREDG